jgi:hypothetical protein
MVQKCGIDVWHHYWRHFTMLKETSSRLFSRRHWRLMGKIVSKIRLLFRFPIEHYIDRYGDPQNMPCIDLVDVDAGVLFARGWLDEDACSPVSSLDARLVCLAGIELLKRGKVKRLICCGGQTLGPEKWSEAQAMQDFILNVAPELAGQVFTEDVSYDTPTGMIELRSQNLISIDESILAVGIDSHILRIWALGKIYGMHFKYVLPAFHLAKRINPAVWDWKSNSPTHSRMKEYLIEFTLTTLLTIDPYGYIPRLITKKMRGQQ